MKKYKFKFSTVYIILFIAGMCLSVLAVTLNVIRLVKELKSDIAITFYGYFAYGMIFVLAAAFIALATAALISSYYRIGDDAVILRWGFISNKIKFAEILKITCVPDKKRLELSLKDDTFFAIVIKDVWFDDFVTELKEKHPHIKRIYVRAAYQYIDDSYKNYLLESYDDTYYPLHIENAGKASYVERNQEMIDKSKYCVIYYDENYLPKRQKTEKGI